MTTLYTLEEAAVELRCTPGWLGDQIAKRRIDCTRIGRKRFMTAEQIAKVISDGEQPAVVEHREPAGITSRSLARRTA